MKNIKIGMRVKWNDPDEGKCSGLGTVIALQHTPVETDSVVSLKIDGGVEVEAFPLELKGTKIPKYPNWVCHVCGLKAMKKAKIKLSSPMICTSHDGVCDICGKKRSVTEPRDYGHAWIKLWKLK